MVPEAPFPGAYVIIQAWLENTETMPETMLSPSQTPMPNSAASIELFETEPAVNTIDIHTSVLKMLPNKVMNNKSRLFCGPYIM